MAVTACKQVTLTSSSNMGQLTFNLVAITIFGVTMMALVGPMINLSPVVPAIAIAAVLGVATVDQTSWGGTLGNLLIDGCSRFSAQHRQRVICHEAGHFLVAQALEIPVTGYTLTAWEAWRQGFSGQGGVQFDTTTLEASLSQGQLPAQLLNRYCMVWMAGIAAEQLIYGEALGGRDDRQKFTLLWQQLGRPAQEGLTRQRWAALQARTLLDTHAEAHAALMTAMEQGRSPADCQLLLQQKLTAEPSPKVTPDATIAS